MSTAIAINLQKQGPQDINPRGRGQAGNTYRISARMESLDADVNKTNTETVKQLRPERITCSRKVEMKLYKRN